MKPEAIEAMNRLLDLGKMPVGEQKAYVREWPELGWDGIIVAKALQEILDCVSILDDPMKVWTDDEWDAETNEKELHEKYTGACKLVAEMHAAAVGEVTGPRFGPVEDVSDLKSRFDSLAKRHERIFEALKRAHSWFGGIEYTDNIRDKADELIGQMSAAIYDECTEQGYADLAAAGGIVGAP